MKSVILKTASNYLLPLLLLFSVFMLLRGHYLPGGGFIGGLIASIAFVLHAFAQGLKRGGQLFSVHPGFLMPLGLSIALLSGVAPVLFTSQMFLTGLWYPEAMPVVGLIGTALFFDIGVYFVVVGVTLTIIFTIVETA
jgi:multicomponent Na+:H+ antiporter subunit B